MLPLKFTLFVCNQERNNTNVYVEVVVETDRRKYDYRCREGIRKYLTLTYMCTKN